MASSRLTRNGRWEFVVQCKTISSKPFYFTFDSKEEGDIYCGRLEALLKQGIVPPDLQTSDATQFSCVADVIRQYLIIRAVKVEDKELLNRLAGRIGVTQLVYINLEWIENWIKTMKTVDNLSPSTIKHYVGALGRCFDWAANRKIPSLVVNPIRLLPKGYATYNDHDIANLGEGMTLKENVERDRRLEADEEERIRKIMAGVKPDNRQRPLAMKYRCATECMFDLALETAMRMRETYTLTLDQIDFNRRTIFLDKTKNGHKRQVPLSSVAIAALKKYMEQVKNSEPDMAEFKFASKKDRIFPWWDGSLDQESLEKVTARISASYRRIFEAAGCVDLRYHDLRHEATSRLFERTQMTDTKIAKITGHSSARMLARYANLRGSNLADEMW